MFAAVYLPVFYLQAALRHSPEVYFEPAVLVDGDATKGTIEQVTAAARAAGVTEGLPSAQAMARCPSLIFKTRSPVAEQAATDALLQTAAAFSPYIEETAPGICTIDLKGLGFELPPAPVTSNAGTAQQQSSFGFLDAMPMRSKSAVPKSPLQTWAENLIAALESVHLRASIGIARTPSFALLAARSVAAQALPFSYGVPASAGGTVTSPKTSTPQSDRTSLPQNPIIVADEKAFLAALPLEALQPDADMLDVLRRWGIHRVAEFVALGKDAIAERLGAEALELFERVSIDRIRPLDIVSPPTSFTEEMEFETPVETLEPLLFILRRFIEQLATRIALTYRVVAQIELRLVLESGATYSHEFKIPVPTSHVDTLFRMLQTHLEQVRTDAAITGLRLGATPSRPENQQFGLFESALRDPNQFHETLARLVALLGHDRVGTAVVEQTHRPDVIHMRRPEFESASSVAVSPPPNATGLALRRFRPALHADVELADGKPVFVQTMIVSGVVEQSRGPWISSGDWWDQKRWARNEWDVEFRDGTLCRLYSAREEWFLEGVYD
jgi:protein ImuB